MRGGCSRRAFARRANSGVYLLRGNFALWPWETSPGRVSQQEPQAGEGGGGGPADSRVTSDTVVGEPSRPRRGAGTTEGSRLWFETLRGLPGSTWAPGAQAGVGPGLAQHGPWPQASGLRTGGSRGDRRRGCPRRTRSQGVPPMSLLAVSVHALVASCVVTCCAGSSNSPVGGEALALRPACVRRFKCCSIIESSPRPDPPRGGCLYLTGEGPTTGLPGGFLLCPHPL